MKNENENENENKREREERERTREHYALLALRTSARILSLMHGAKRRQCC
jgi:hypothetical protein